MNIASMIVIIAVMLFCGCASVEKGRFSVIDFDLRSPEQITAQIPENTCIYASTNDPSTEVATPKAFPFDLLFNFFNVMKGRIRILNLEWKTNNGE